MSVHLPGVLLCAVALASCGGGERQDAHEPNGRFRVDVTKAAFPVGQKLAKASTLQITVRNAETERAVPNVAVTVHGFTTRLRSRALADPNRPVFVVNGRPREIGGQADAQEVAPAGGETAYVDTWALGRLRPGQSRTFRWRVTAVRPGPYKLRYAVAAGLNGKARAVAADGHQPRGSFAGTVSDKPPATRVGDDGRTIMQGTR